MTWQGGKVKRGDAAPLPFAPLRAWAGVQDDASTSVERLASVLDGLPTAVRLHVRLVSGPDGASVEYWDLQGGARGAKARTGEPKKADVVVVTSAQTWMEMAQGRLAPYEALYTGRLRVGGDFALAKAIVKHLTDPTVAYVAPC